MKKNITYCISIDWLQLHFFALDKRLFDIAETPSGLYRLKQKALRSPVFSKFISIEIQNRCEWEEIAVLSYEPHSNILPSQSVHLKMVNKYLYSTNLESFVKSIAHDLKLEFKSISRLDISCDFFRFNHCTVPAFIKQFINKKLLKYKSCSFHCDGFASKSMLIHYVRFGSRVTPVHFYIYNKSKELREKTKKPHIEQKWKEHKLLHKSYDVWRMEFVLTPSKHGFVSQDGDLLQMNSLEIFNAQYLKDLFFSLVGRYAQFVINDGQKRKDRMQKIALFNDEPYHDKYIRVDDLSPSTRVDKMYIKKLYQMQNEWRLFKQEGVTIKDAFHEYIRKKGLEEWAISKGLIMSQEFDM